MHSSRSRIVGVVVGGLFGLFGVGGSSFATPLLSLAGPLGLRRDRVAVARDDPGRARRCAPVRAAATQSTATSRAGRSSAAFPRRSSARCCRGSSVARRCSSRPASCSAWSACACLRPISAASVAAGTRAPSTGPVFIVAIAAARRPVHRSARERRRLPARARVPPRARAVDAHGVGHEPARRRRAHDPDADHALGARPHRLAAPRSCSRSARSRRRGSSAARPNASAPSISNARSGAARRVLDLVRRLPPLLQVGALT